eukprot:171165-Rhodomonas_salina.1
MTMEAGGISGALANLWATGSLSVTVIGSGFSLVGVTQAGCVWHLYGPHTVIYLFFPILSELT